METKVPPDARHLGLSTSDFHAEEAPLDAAPRASSSDASPHLLRPGATFWKTILLVLADGFTCPSFASGERLTVAWVVCPAATPSPDSPRWSSRMAAGLMRPTTGPCRSEPGAAPAAAGGHGRPGAVPRASCGWPDTVLHRTWPSSTAPPSSAWPCHALGWDAAPATALPPR